MGMNSLKLEDDTLLRRMHGDLYQNYRMLIEYLLFWHVRWYGHGVEMYGYLCAREIGSDGFLISLDNYVTSEKEIYSVFLHRNLTHPVEDFTKMVVKCICYVSYFFQIELCILCIFWFCKVVDEQDWPTHFKNWF